MAARFLRRYYLLIVAGALGVLLYPRHDFEMQYLIDPHRASTCILQALYAYSSDILPVRDIFSQYGIGPGFVCRIILHDNVLDTVNSFNLFHCFLKFIFAWTLYLLFFKFFRTHFLATVATALVFFWQFIASPIDLTFIAPTTTAYRYPLLPLIGLALMGLFDDKRPWAVGVSILGALLGAELYWSTDAGVSICLAAGVVTVLMDARSRRRGLVRGVALAVVTLATLLGLIAVTYGPGFFEIDWREFLRYPMMYSLGFGGVPPTWADDFNEILIAVSGHVLLIATLAHCLIYRHERDNKILAFFALTGILLQMKFYNRAYGAYFYGDAVGFLMAAVYWLNEFLDWGLARWPESRRSPMKKGAIAGLSLWTLITVGQPRTGNVPGLRAYYLAFDALEMPYRLRRLMGSPMPEPPDVETKYHTTAAERQLIQDNLPPNDPLVIISERDWLYALETQRAPGVYKMPLADAFEVRPYSLLKERLKTTRVVFVDDSTAARAFDTVEFAAYVATDFQANFVKEKTAGRITMWRNRNLL